MNTGFVDLKELVKKSPILRTIDLNLCVTCKAVQAACGHRPCPLVVALDLYPKEDQILRSVSDGTIFGPSQQIFVGSANYPRVLSGPMTDLQPDGELSKLKGNPSLWTDLSLKEIVGLRFQLLRGKQKIFVRPDKDSKSLHIQEKLQELSLSEKPVEIEGKYVGKISQQANLNAQTQPMGPSGVLKNFELTSNPVIPKKVDAVLGDELKASEQIIELHDNKYDVYYLQNIFSSGATGLNVSKKIVPTRWGITAVDDLLGQDMIKGVRDYPSIGQIEVKRGHLLGNYYTLFMLPGKFCFENVEAWLPGNIFTLAQKDWVFKIDREGFDKREIMTSRKKTYSIQAGGYYASRLSLLEYLHKIRKQAEIFIIREITPEYTIPVGVWQVREGMRLTTEAPSVKFTSKHEAMKWAVDRLYSKTSKYFHKSWIFTSTKIQDYFT